MLSLWANLLVTKFGLNSLKRYLWPVLYIYVLILWKKDTTCMAAAGLLAVQLCHQRNLMKLYERKFTKRGGNRRRKKYVLDLQSNIRYMEDVFSNETDRYLINLAKFSLNNNNENNMNNLYTAYYKSLHFTLYFNS